MSQSNFNFVNAYQQTLDGKSVVSSYQTVITQDELLTYISDKDIEHIYNNLSKELNDAIIESQQTDKLLAELARQVMVEIKAAYESPFHMRFRKTQTDFHDHTLLNILHKTTLLLKTPPLTSDLKINDDYIKATREYDKSIRHLRAEGWSRAIGGALTSFITAMALAGTIAMGFFSAILPPLIPLPILCAVPTLFGAAITAGLFRSSHQHFAMANKLQPLQELAHKRIAPG
jgi:hypothetical protein